MRSRIASLPSAFVSLSLALVACGGGESVRETIPSPLKQVARQEPPSLEPPPPVVPFKPEPYVAPSPPPAPRKADMRGVRVVVDPGHGGKDPGARSVIGHNEKAIVLDIGLEVARILRGKGAIVTLTRDRDVFIELDGRCAIAERNRADVFVSVHADSIAKKSYSGGTIYHAPNASSTSKRLARSIEQSFKGAGIPVRGVRGDQNFRVLVKHSRPAVLVECGYLTNAVDARNLGNDSYRDKVAAAIVRGIEDGLVESGVPTTRADSGASGFESRAGSAVSADLGARRK